jgi:hypothetical protein
VAKFIPDLDDLTARPDSRSREQALGQARICSQPPEDLLGIDARADDLQNLQISQFARSWVL